MNNKSPFKKSSSLKEKFRGRAQTATELAIFGSVLIFVLGVVIRSALHANLNQNQALEGIRRSFKMSYDSAYAFEARRNSSTLLFVEDRTTADVGKYGSQSRVPIMMSSSGTFSNNLYMPIESSHTEDLPVMDMFINGQHFVFTTAGMRRPNLDPQNNYQQDTSAENPYLFEIVTNDSTSKFGVGTGDCGPHDPECNCRFDLDRSGSRACLDAHADDGIIGNRNTFAWQWKNNWPSSCFSKIHDRVDVDGDLRLEQVLEYVDEFNNTWTAKNWEDLDDDYTDCVRFTRVYVIDYQEGDLDMGINQRDKDGAPTPHDPGGRDPMPDPGLQNDLNMYAFTRDGTYLLIEEESSSNTLIRNIQKRNRVDIIERQVQLTNHTGLVCTKDIPPIPNLGHNPDVEACNDCFSQDNIYRTCFDTDLKILYVRSRVADLRGRKWITEIDH